MAGPKHSTEFKFDVILFDSDGAVVASPTLAAGDAKVYQGDGNSANLTTLPTVVDGRVVVTLSAAEVGTNDRVFVKLVDAAGDEWEPTGFGIFPEAYQMADLPAAIWAATTRSLTTFGTLVADIATAVWAAATRTLTQSAASVAAAVDGDTVTVYRGDRWSVSLTGLGSLAGRTALYVTVKKAKSMTDAESLLQVKETTGLLVWNRETATAANGSLTVDDASAGDITIVVEAADTDDAPCGTYAYDIQMVTADGPTTISDGVWNVEEDVTRRIA